VRPAQFEQSHLVNMQESAGSSPTVRILKSPLGGLVARPWLDRCLLLILKYLVFPPSRLGAAARAAQGDVDEYIAAAPLGRPGQWRRRWIRRALARFERARLRAFSTEQLWHLYFFGAEEVACERLPIVEEMRLDNRTAYNLSRGSHLPMLGLLKTSVHMAPPTPQDVMDSYGADGEGLEALFELPREFPPVAVSQCVPQGLFLEGALSRDGKLQPLKMGMLNYLLKARGHGDCKDIVFVPAGLNYDKIPEDRTLLAHREEGFSGKGRFYSLVSFIRFFVTVITYATPR
jgi:hypothetical protein